MRLDRTDFTLALNAAPVLRRGCARPDDQGQGRRGAQPQARGRRLDLEADLRPEQGRGRPAIAQFANAEAQASQIENQPAIPSSRPTPTAVVMDVPSYPESGRRRPDRGEAGTDGAREAEIFLPEASRPWPRAWQRRRSTPRARRPSRPDCANCQPSPTRPRGPIAPATSFPPAAARMPRWAQP